ncbi:hypothetical protein BvCmsL97A_00417 [Escherichia coli]|nr:hypothetical protein BvCmsL97A_00417 [Escherichia coli]
MSFTDNWSDEEFIRQMKELIGNEGDIHVTCNHSVTNGAIVIHTQRLKSDPGGNLLS